MAQLHQQLFNHTISAWRASSFVCNKVCLKGPLMCTEIMIFFLMNNMKDTQHVFDTIVTHTSAVAPWQTHGYLLLGLVVSTWTAPCKLHSSHVAENVLKEVPFHWRCAHAWWQVSYSSHSKKSANSSTFFKEDVQHVFPLTPTVIHLGKTPTRVGAWWHPLIIRASWDINFIPSGMVPRYSLFRNVISVMVWHPLTPRGCEPLLSCRWPHYGRGMGKIVILRHLCIIGS